MPPHTCIALLITARRVAQRPNAIYKCTPSTSISRAVSAYRSRSSSSASSPGQVASQDSNAAASSSSSSPPGAPHSTSPPPSATDSVHEVKDDRFSAAASEELLQRPAASPQAIGKIERRLNITFTCTVPNCGHRSSHEFSRHAYEKGIVLVQCPGCESRHLLGSIQAENAMNSD